MSVNTSPLKTVRNQDGGGAKEVGGDDYDRIADIINGVPNVATPKINCDTAFGYRRLWLMNQANNASVNLAAGAITASVLYTFPPQNTTDEVLLRDAPQRVKGKTFSGTENTFLDIEGGGVSGRIQAPRAAKGGFAAEGVLAGFIDMNPAGPPSSNIADAPYGHHWIYSTSTTVNTNVGIRYPTGTAFVRPSFDPWMRVKFRTPTTGGNHQLLVGFSSDESITPDQEVILSSQSAVMVGYRHTPDTSFMVFRNAGTTSVGSQPTYESAGGAGRGTALREIEIQFTNSGQQVTVTIRNPVGNTLHFGPQTYATNLPPAATLMYPVIQLTNRNASNHDFHLHRVDFKQAY